jgi:hypothetical protein
MTPQAKDAPGGTGGGGGGTVFAQVGKVMGVTVQLTETPPQLAKPTVPTGPTANTVIVPAQGGAFGHTARALPLERVSNGTKQGGAASARGLSRVTDPARSARPVTRAMARTTTR